MVDAKALKRLEGMKYLKKEVREAYLGRRVSRELTKRVILPYISYPERGAPVFVSGGEYGEEPAFREYVATGRQIIHRYLLMYYQELSPRWSSVTRNNDLEIIIEIADHDTRFLWYDAKLLVIDAKDTKVVWERVGLPSDSVYGF